VMAKMGKKNTAKTKSKRKDSIASDAPSMKHPNRMLKFRLKIQKRAKEMGRRISVDQFAAAAGITTSYWRMLEHGEYDPRNSLKEKIAWVLNRNVNEIFTYDKSNHVSEGFKHKGIESPFCEYGGKAQSKKETKSIWEIVKDLIKDIPDEAWNDLPKDGALNHDHYLYGGPKKYR